MGRRNPRCPRSPRAADRKCFLPSKAVPSTEAGRRRFHRHFIGKCRGVAKSLRRKAGQHRSGTRRSGERQLLKQRPGRFGLIAAAVDRGSEESSRFPPGEAGAPSRSFDPV